MIFIGIDGGGTKSVITAVKNGTRIASAKTGPMNYNFRDPREAAEEIAEGIASLGLPAGETAAVGIGDPSIDDMPDGGDISPFYSCLSEKLDSPVYVRSDAYMTLFGLTGGKKPGTLVISGTGAMAIAENGAGEIKTAGGWGRLTGDEGSGYYIALRGIKAALRAFDGISENTALCRAVTGFYGVGDPRKLIGVFYGEKEPDIAAFASEVARTADAGDPAAKRILLDAASYLASYAVGLANWSGSEVIGVYGSVLTKNAAVRDSFERLVRERHGDIVIKEPDVSPEYAAAVYAEKKYIEERGIGS